MNRVTSFEWPYLDWWHRNVRWTEVFSARWIHVLYLFWNVKSIRSKPINLCWSNLQTRFLSKNYKFFDLFPFDFM